MDRRQRQIIWTSEALVPRRLRSEGYRVLNYPRLKRQIARIRSQGGRRKGLANPAAPVLDIFRNHSRVAVLGVDLESDTDLHLLYGYVVEPAFRNGCTLLLGADIDQSRLAAAPALSEPFWGYDWSRERLLHLLAEGRQPREVAVSDRVPRGRRLWNKLWRRGSRPGPAPAPGERLDPQQLAAVRAGDGVVQIIAPAGSGKTTVLIRRVQELQERGTPAANILCMSFNRDAKEEMAARLEKAGLSGVVVRSFHGMGREILQEEGLLRENLGELPDADLQAILDYIPDNTPDNMPDNIPDNQLQLPPAEVGAQSTPLPPAEVQPQLTLTDARNLISEFKLALLVTPEQARHPLYSAYEAELARRQQLDFDDLIARTVRLLQTDPRARRRWQQRFQRVLVDEYQDIEPAQALLVGMLAAPQDSLFCVGDEDQCIYAWRRATVRRIIELDQVYPGLERHALVRNYRCGRRITEASRRLVEHNRVRFRKPLHSGARDHGTITAVATADRAEGARLVAWLLSDAEPATTAVLARTDRLLEEVRAACRQAGTDLTGIELATIHGAKGREWPRVILYGVDEGQAPHAASLKEGEIEAERRLFYVALTRAQERLEIICSRGRESRFLEEAGIQAEAE
jgi:superfamily I DNA/RNA helicase